MSDPRWLVEARKHVGLREIKGAKHNPEILQFWKDIKRGGIKDDETPWCAAFAGAMLERVGIVSPRFEGAAHFLNWGVKLDRPVLGCAVVFTRTGGGHVGFVVGVTSTGSLVVLGGNQEDSVKYSVFKRDNVTGYRYPVGEVIPTDPLPVLNNAGAPIQSMS